MQRCCATSKAASRTPAASALSRRCLTPQPLVFISRSQVAVVHAAGPHDALIAEAAAYRERERLLLAELAAVRSQVDRLIDQQQVLLGMVTGLAGSPRALAAPSAPGLPSSAVAQQPVSQPAWSSNAPGAPYAQSFQASTPAYAPSAATAPSEDVPTPSSLADIFRRAATTSVPHPSASSAASAVAAAIAAVDQADVLSMDGPLARSSLPTAFNLNPASAPLFTAGSTSIAPPAAPQQQEPTTSSSSSKLQPQEQPVEVVKAPAQGAPPDLAVGDDDIHWMSKLHSSLESKGFWSGDDDVDNWFFGDGTQQAVMMFQASARLPETGVVDKATWVALLGPGTELLWQEAPASAAADPALLLLQQQQSNSPASASSMGSPLDLDPASSLLSAASTTTTSISRVSSSSSVGVSVVLGAGGARHPGELPEDVSTWPVLMDQDGGRAVHALQVALTNAGFYCGEDDMRYWMLGDSSITALRFFQSCNKLPESGVCDERTWRALLGPGAQPRDLLSLRLNSNSDADDDFEDDLETNSGGRVWLVGEQRWERRAER